jgi:phytoene desaturase
MGVYYISGGMYRLVDALLHMCNKHNVNMHFETRVEKILITDHKATGLIVNGDKIFADYIVCNNDVVTTYESLIQDHKARSVKLKKLEPSLSGLVFLWGIKKSHANLGHHNIFFSADYQKEFRQLFGELKSPDDPTVYISVSSKVDKDHAAAGGENWFVLVNMPYMTQGQNWSQNVTVLRKIVLNKLQNFGFDVENSIEVEDIITPPMFYDLYGSNRGSIYGLSSNSRFAAFMRPANRNRDIDGLYFVGGSTHPGGGIPLVTLSGKMVSDLIARREGLKPGAVC